jgi:hypothetical protein
MAEIHATPQWRSASSPLRKHGATLELVVGYRAITYVKQRRSNKIAGSGTAGCAEPGEWKCAFISIPDETTAHTVVLGGNAVLSNVPPTSIPDNSPRARARVAPTIPGVDSALRAGPVLGLPTLPASGARIIAAWASASTVLFSINCTVVDSGGLGLASVIAAAETLRTAGS